MNVAQVCPRYGPNIGGIETCVKLLSQRLVKKGYEVEVLTTDPMDALPMEMFVNGIMVRQFRSWVPKVTYFKGGLRNICQNSR